ncbi:MAG: cobalt ECF transporter T component CbiQ [Candidatus Bathyarchaeia archaeon]
MNVKGLLLFFEDTLRIERYAMRSSRIHRLDARVKLLLSLAVVVTAVTVRSLLSLVFLAALIAVLAAVSRVPTRYFLLRSALIPTFSLIMGLPFLFIIPGARAFALSLGDIVLAATWQGAERLAFFVVRVWVCVASVFLLGLTTRFAAVLEAMRRLGVPRLFVDTLMMTYRYLFLFVEEAYRLVVAREARTLLPEGRLRFFRSLGGVLGALFIRAYERGERVYLAMASRGYPSLQAPRHERSWHTPEVVILAAVFLYCLSIWVAEFLRYGGFMD